MRQELVYKGAGPQGTAYTPVAKCVGCSQVVKDQYINREVQELIERMEDSRGTKLSAYDKRRLYLDISPLWENSERVKEQIQQEIKARRSQYKGLVLTKQQRDANTIVRACPRKAQEMIKCLADIEKLFNAIFTPRLKKEHLYQVKQQLETV